MVTKNRAGHLSCLLHRDAIAFFDDNLPLWDKHNRKNGPPLIFNGQLLHCSVSVGCWDFLFAHVAGQGVILIIDVTLANLDVLADAILVDAAGASVHTTIIRLYIVEYLISTGESIVGDFGHCSFLVTLLVTRVLYMYYRHCQGGFLSFS